MAVTDQSTRCTLTMSDVERARLLTLLEREGWGKRTSRLAVRNRPITKTRCTKQETGLQGRSKSSAVPDALHRFPDLPGEDAAMTGEFLAVEAIVDILRGSRNKYEFDPNSGAFVSTVFSFSSVHYPGDYGFIVGTKCGDSDPLDVLILVEEPTFPGCRVLARPIGVLFMEDEGGDDEKILAVPQGDPRFAEVYDLKDLPHHWLTEVENFFATYKVLEGKTARTGEWKSAGKPAWHWQGLVSGRTGGQKGDNI